MWCYANLRELMIVLLSVTCSMQMSAATDPEYCESRQNFKCFSYDGYNFSCTWDTENNTTYDVIYFHEEYPATSHSCDDDEGEGSCHFTIDDINDVQFCTAILTENWTNYVEQSELQYLPRAPDNFRISDTASDAVTLNWETQDQSMMTHTLLFMQWTIMYYVYYTQIQGSAWTVIEELTYDFSSSLTFRVSDLEPYTSYSFKMTSRYEDVDCLDGDFTDTVTVTTSESAPESPVTVTYTASEVENGVRDVLVLWSLPDSKFYNGAILGFNISFESDDSSVTYYWSVDSDTSEVGVYNISVLVTYTCEVVMYNSAGSIGVTFVIPRLTSDDIPGTFTIIWAAVDSGSLNVSWIADDSSTSDDSIYVLRWCEIECTAISDGLKTMITNLSTMTSYVIGGLTPFIRYEILIGAGSQTYGPVYGFTNETRPYSCPEIFNITDITSENITIHWLEVPASDQGGVIIMYIVYLCEASAFNNDTCETDTVRTVSIVDTEDTGSLRQGQVSGLDPYTVYYLSMSAVTIAGEGPVCTNWTCVETATTAPSGAPVSVTVTSVSVDSIEISWDPPLITNSDATTYQITVTNTVLGNTTVRDTTATNIDMYGVVGYTNYTVSVCGCTLTDLDTLEYACGPWSANVYVITPIGNPGPPEFVEATPYDWDKVNVFWGSPETPNGPISGFLVNWRRSTPSSDTFGQVWTQQQVDAVLQYVVSIDCPLDNKGSTVNILVQAINMDDNMTYVGDNSSLTTIDSCTPTDMTGSVVESTFKTVGIILLIITVVVLLPMLACKLCGRQWNKSTHYNLDGDYHAHMHDGQIGCAGECRREEFSHLGDDVDSLSSGCSNNTGLANVAFVRDERSSEGGSSRPAPSGCGEESDPPDARPMRSTDRGDDNEVRVIVNAERTGTPVDPPWTADAGLSKEVAHPGAQRYRAVSLPLAGRNTSGTECDYSRLGAGDRLFSRSSSSKWSPPSTRGVGEGDRKGLELKCLDPEVLGCQIDMPVVSHM